VRDGRGRGGEFNGGSRIESSQLHKEIFIEENFQRSDGDSSSSSSSSSRRRRRRRRRSRMSFIS